MSLSGNETMGEIQDAFDLLEKQFHRDATIVLNTVTEQKGETEVSLIVTGFA